MNRRGFLKSILAAGVGPAVVGSGVLMPVRKIITPELVLWGNTTSVYVGSIEHRCTLLTVSMKRIRAAWPRWGGDWAL